MQDKLKINRKKRQKGFTFVEVIIVIGIVGIMLSIGFVSLRPAQDLAKLKAAQSEVAADIKQAQSNALQGKMTGGSVPKYYGVRFNADGKTYYLCYSNILTSCNNIIYTQKLKDGVASNAGGKMMMFDVPNGNYKSAALVITFTLNTKTKTVTIGANGSIAQN
ncbi:MAG: prepilin-type N-terminal cleavage/methylation domain-containing protein [Parcubacteria group bacterium]